MQDLIGLPTSRKLILAAGTLLFIDSFFAWQKVEVKIGGVAVVSATANAWHGFWGVLLCLMTIALVAWVAARAFGVALPAAVPDGLVILALGALILLFAVLKNLTDDYSAWASYVGIVLAAGVALGAWRAFQESGDSLPQMTRPPDAGVPTPPAPPADSKPPETPADTQTH
jgi:hypothetical protein